MIRLFTILLLLISFNGWTNEAYDNCIAIAEEAKNNVLQPTDWSKIEAAINKEEALIPETASIKAQTSGKPTFSQRRIRAREIELDMQKEIEQKRIQLEYDKQAEQSKIAESKKQAINDYVELLKVCSELNVIKFEGKIE